MRGMHFKNRYLLLIDVFMCLFAHALILLISHSVSGFTYYFAKGAPMMCATTLVYVFCIVVFKNYYVAWDYSSAKEYTSLLFSCLLAACISIFAGIVTNEEVYYLKLNFAAYMGLTALICFVRFCVKAIG